MSGFPKFAGHVRRILKMSGEELPDRRTKCPARKKMNPCSQVILSLKMSDESLRCPAKNLRFAGHFRPASHKKFSGSLGCQLLSYNFIQSTFQTVTIISISSNYLCQWSHHVSSKYPPSICRLSAHDWCAHSMETQ